jgi:DNA-binding cell septation regulator SpoVG
VGTSIKVDIRLLEDSEDLLAYADVTFRVKFGEITIRRFKVLQGEKKPWVAFPQIQYYQFLKARYVNLLNMNKRVEDYIKNQVLKAYRHVVREAQKQT